MPDTIRQLIEEYPYYEVLPYYVALEERHGSPSATFRSIQAGFDVDIYATIIENPPWQSHKYQLGYEELQNLVQALSHNANNFCSVEVIASCSDISFDTGNNFQQQAMLRIRVSHYRGVDQLAGPAEEDMLQQIENQLQQLGIRFGKPGSR
ncbi:MAG: hypothetical protein JO336_10100 [Acidobacteriia bacterium]|nr:hypothetical protein [Terriglobia bacterium]